MFRLAPPAAHGQVERPTVPSTFPGIGAQREPIERPLPRRTQPAPVFDLTTAAGMSAPRASRTAPTPQHNFSHFSAFSAMVLLDNTLHDDAKRALRHACALGCAQTPEPAGGGASPPPNQHRDDPRLYLDDADSSELPDTIERDVRADCRASEVSPA